MNLLDLEQKKGLPKKIVILAARSSIHTVRWANSLAQKSHEVVLISMHEGGDPLNESVKYYKLRWGSPLGYVLNFLRLRKILKKENPDIFNVHFASGYGTLAALCGRHSQILSVWGTDVFGFPEKSRFHKILIRSNLKRASWICSTSQVMAERVLSIYKDAEKKMTVVPFGVDLGNFEKMEKAEGSTGITIGTVKTFEDKYGIDILLKGFALMKNSLQDAGSPLADKVKLVLYGKGSRKNKLKKMAYELGIGNLTVFKNAVAHSDVPRALNSLDIYVAMSRAESFGVAIIEASSCELPVVVSPVGGLPEVVDDNQTGFVTEKNSPECLAKRLEELVVDKELRTKMGIRGREKVRKLYSWNENVELMERVYEHVFQRAEGKSL